MQACGLTGDLSVVYAGWFLFFVCPSVAALADRLLDFDENVRKQVVAVICDVACLSLNAIPLDTIKLVAERLRDKSVHHLLLLFKLMWWLSRLFMMNSDGFSCSLHMQLLVKKYTMERLAEIYMVYSVKSSVESTNPDDFTWIPGRILRCFYDKDFR